MTFALVGVARAAPDTVRVYGPGGPLPAVKEAAETFGKARGIDVQVTAGPKPCWIDTVHFRLPLGPRRQVV